MDPGSSDFIHGTFTVVRAACLLLPYCRTCTERNAESTNRWDYPLQSL